MNNAQLLHYHKQIQSFAGGILEIWFRPKIQEFYKHNSIRINTLTEKLNSLSDEYFQMKDKQLLYDGNKNPVMKDGKDVNEYKAKFDEIMKQEINIII